MFSRWRILEQLHYYSLCEGKLRNNSTVFEELEVSIVDLMVAIAVLPATRIEASKTDICDRQIHN
jgi:hypothetical protein